MVSEFGPRRPFCWFVVLRFNATLTAKVISWRSVTPTTFLTCFCRSQRRKYAGKKVRLNRGSNLRPPGHESDKLTTELPGRGATVLYGIFQVVVVDKEILL